MDSLNEIEKLIEQKKFKEIDKETIEKVMRFGSILSKYYYADGNIRKKYVGNQIISYMVEGKLQDYVDIFKEWIKDFKGFTFSSESNKKALIQINDDEMYRLREIFKKTDIYLPYLEDRYIEQYDDNVFELIFNYYDSIDKKWSKFKIRIRFLYEDAI